MAAQQTVQTLIERQIQTELNSKWHTFNAEARGIGYTLIESGQKLAYSQRATLSNRALKMCSDTVGIYGLNMHKPVRLTYGNVDGDSDVLMMSPFLFLGSGLAQESHGEYLALNKARISHTAIPERSADLNVAVIPESSIRALGNFLDTSTGVSSGNYGTILTQPIVSICMPAAHYGRIFGSGAPQDERDLAYAPFKIRPSPFLMSPEARGRALSAFVKASAEEPQIRNENYKQYIF